MGIRTDLYRNEGLYAISFGHEFTYLDYGEFKGVYEHIPAEASHLVLNLKETTVLDSTALGQMILMHDYLNPRVLRVQIINANKNVENVLKMTHFDEIFEIEYSQAGRQGRHKRRASPTVL